MGGRASPRGGPGASPRRRPRGQEPRRPGPRAQPVPLAGPAAQGAPPPAPRRAARSVRPPHHSSHVPFHTSSCVPETLSPGHPLEDRGAPLGLGCQHRSISVRSGTRVHSTHAEKSYLPCFFQTIRCTLLPQTWEENAAATLLPPPVTPLLHHHPPHREPGKLHSDCKMHPLPPKFGGKVCLIVRKTWYSVKTLRVARFLRASERRGWRQQKRPALPWPHPPRATGTFPPRHPVPPSEHTPHRREYHLNATGSNARRTARSPPAADGALTCFRWLLRRKDPGTPFLLSGSLCSS